MLKLTELYWQSRAAPRSDGGEKRKSIQWINKAYRAEKPQAELYESLKTLKYYSTHESESAGKLDGDITSELAECAAQICHKTLVIHVD